MAVGTVVVLNGASSSGKSSILHALQDTLEPPYLEAGLDKFIFMLPERYLERPLWDDVLGLADHAGLAGRTLVTGMHQAIAALARAGSNILSDHVLVELAWRSECAALFSGLPAYLVGIRCPLDVLETRERSRRNRTLGQAARQFPLVHAGLSYDLEVDTSILSPQECALRIKARLGTGAPQAFLRLNQGG